MVEYTPLRYLCFRVHTILHDILGFDTIIGNNVIYSQDLGYLILGLGILCPENFVNLLVLLGFEDP